MKNDMRWDFSLCLPERHRKQHWDRSIPVDLCDNWGGSIPADLCNTSCLRVCHPACLVCFMPFNATCSFLTPQNPFSQKFCQDIWQLTLPRYSRKWYVCCVFDHTFIGGGNLLVSSLCSQDKKYAKGKKNMFAKLSRGCIDSWIKVVLKSKSMASVNKTHGGVLFILSDKSKVWMLYVLNAILFIIIKRQITLTCVCHPNL